MGKAVAIAQVDRVDDHVETGQQLTEDVDGPSLQGLGHDRVVGVGDRGKGDLKGEVEVDALLVHENAHELRTTHRGVRVIGVDGDVVGKMLPVGPMSLLVAAKYRLEASAHKEVLLLKTEQPPVLARVVRIEYLADGLDV